MNEEFMNRETAMIVSEKMKADLLSSAKWAKFLCIIGCIGLVFMVLAGIGMIALGGFVSSHVPGGGAGLGAPMGVFYLILAVIYIYPLIKGFQFANATKAACLSNNEGELARGIDGMRCWLKFCGILTIIYLVICVLALLIGIIAGFAAASQF